MIAQYSAFRTLNRPPEDAACSSGVAQTDPTVPGVNHDATDDFYLKQTELPRVPIESNCIMFFSARISCFFYFPLQTVFISLYHIK